MSTPHDPGATGDEVLQDRFDRPVLRVGDMVRHPLQPWSASVHALLTHLEQAGFTEAPVPGPREGLETGGVDDVTFIPGVSGDEACLLVQSDDAVAQIGRMLRRYHDAVAEWRPEELPVWFDGQTGTGMGTSTAMGAGAGTGTGTADNTSDGHAELLVCHGDVAPWNLVWRDGELVGLIDWEYATVGTRRQDVAYALHYLAPFRDRSYWEGVLGMTERPKRRHRIRVFTDAYGIEFDDRLVEEVLASQRAGVDLMVDLAARGRPRQQQLIADGELDREHRAVLWGEGHRHRFAPRRQRHAGGPPMRGLVP